jgi:hypothetical protein
MKRLGLKWIDNQNSARAAIPHGKTRAQFPETRGWVTITLAEHEARREWSDAPADESPQDRTAAINGKAVGDERGGRHNALFMNRKKSCPDFRGVG